MEMAILWLCVVQFPYTMVPQIENRAPFTGLMRRYSRLLLLGVLLLAGYSGFSQATSPPPYTIVTTMITDNSVDDGASEDVVKIQVFTAYAPVVPVGNVPITVQINGNSNTTVLTTDAAGDPVFFQQGNLSTAPPLNIEISIQIGGVTLTSTLVTFHYVAGPPVLNAAPSYFIVTGNDAAADGLDTNGIQIHVVDGNGQNYPPNTPISFTITSATPASGSMLFRNALYTVTYNTQLGPNGMADITLTDLVAGNVTITASVKDINNGITYTFPNPVTVTFVSPVADPVASTYTTIIPLAPDDGTDTAVVQVHLVAPGGGQVAAGTIVYFTVTSSGPASSNAMMNLTTTANFQEQIGAFSTTGNTIDVPITDLSAGSVTITASVMVGGVLTPISGSPQTVTFSAGPPTINQSTNPSYFTTVTNNQAADGVSQDVVSVFLADASGNGVANWPVTFTITSNNAASTSALFDPPPSGTPTSTTVTVNTSLTTDPSGPGYITLPLTDLQVGSVTITATFVVGGVTVTIPVNQTVNFVTGPPVASNPSNPVPPGGGGGGGGSGTGPSNPSNPSGPGAGFTYLAMTFNNVPADGVSTDTATAYITDAEGHPVSDVMVVFTLHTGGPANGGALFQPQAEIQDTVYTNASGFAAMAISDTIPGNAWVDAAINVGGVLTVINGSSAIANFTQTPDVNNPNTQLIVVVYEATADGSSTTVVEAHIVDGSGNPVAGASVQFAIDSGSATLVGAQPVLTDANGNAIINLTSTTVGYALVTATVGGKAIIFGSPARVIFTGINIYVPRAFSPNNDGTNDLLKPILVGIQTFHYFTVYNRWGNIIFTTTDPNQGWDGTFKGVPQPVETYLWIAEGIDVNGRKIVAKGMTSLVR
jgi:gliding motility-associated-like protein